MAMATPMAPRSTFAIFLILLLRSGHSPAAAFYLPGSYPHRYRPGEALAAKVNSLTSPSSKLPFPYYSLPFCAPQGGVNRAAESLGELLLGDRIETSPYRFSMLKNATAFLCRTDPLPPATADLLMSRIDDAYHVNLLLDTLPVVRYVKNLAAPGVFVRSTGFPVGVRADDGEYYVYNHLKLTVLVNKPRNGTTRAEALMATADAVELISFAGGSKDGGGYTVVGFEVVPCSVEHDAAAIKGKKMYDELPARAAAGCGPSVVGMRVRANRPLVFSYEVAFVESGVEWPSRWDAYLEMGGAKVHWFSILNSIVVVAFLAAILLVILLRTVRRDLAQYDEHGGEAGLAPQADELAGWKLVAGDVFREPAHPPLRGARVHVAGVARRARDGHARHLPPPRLRGGVRRRAALEDGAARGQRRVEARGVARLLRLPRRGLRRLHRAQLRALVQRQHGRRAVPALRRDPPPLGVRLRAAHPRRRAGGIPRRAPRVPGEDEQDREAGAGGAVLAVGVRGGGGDAAVRDAVHRAAVHHVEPVAGEGVLRVRVPAGGDGAAGGRVRRGVGGAHLHGALRGGLEVVVARLLRLGLRRGLHPRLRRLLPRLRPAQPQRPGLRRALRRLLAAHGARRHARHRRRRARRLLRLRLLPLLRRQARLIHGVIVRTVHVISLCR
ncbi:hypothetical protein EE612_043276 [Oryza sativa]|nr:hypothetical protein EE612_043276 [Oryza sativa]